MLNFYQNNIYSNCRENDRRWLAYSNSTTVVSIFGFMKRFGCTFSCNLALYTERKNKPSCENTSISIFFPRFLHMLCTAKLLNKPGTCYPLFFKLSIYHCGCSSYRIYVKIRNYVHKSVEIHILWSHYCTHQKTEEITGHPEMYVS